MNLPNKLTLARIILSPVFAILFSINNRHAKLIAVFVFFVAVLTDALDGYLARKNGWHTGFGKFMDPLADKILTSTALICFVATDYVKAWMVMAIIGREFLITGVRGMAAYKGLVIMPTVLAQWKTASQMAVILGIMSFYVLQMILEPMGVYSAIFTSPLAPRVIDLSVFAVMVLTVVSGLDYLIKNAALLRGVLR